MARSGRLGLALLTATLLVGLPLVAAPAASQVPPTPVPRPDLGPVAGPLDQVLGQVVVPAVGTTYSLLGQNLSREDVRILADLNITKGDVGVLGLVLGSGTIEVDAAVHLRLEIRVLSSDRIRQLVQSATGSDASLHNGTFLQNVYIPADVFRASLSAEAVAAFEKGEENAIADFLSTSVPELRVLGLRVEWTHTLPTEALTDSSLKEPPITLDLFATLQLQRVESIPSLLDSYLASASDPRGAHETDYVQRIKRSHSDAVATRSFFAAAAYDQLLNLSMQPGWSLDMHLAVPRGYKFVYTNENVQAPSDHELNFRVDASASKAQVQDVFVASLTQPKAVAAGLFAGMWVVGLAVAWPLRWGYRRWRMPRFLRPRRRGKGPKE